MTVGNTRDWKNTVAAYYDDDAGKWVKDTMVEPERYYFSPYFTRLSELRPQGNRAIDIGCGGGVFTFELCRYPFSEVYALDISEKMLAALEDEKKRRGIKKVKTVKSDVEKLPFDDNSVDFIVSVGVMECLKDQRKALAEMRRVLKPGGTLYIRWINRQGIWALFERVLKALHIPSSPFSFPDYFTLEEALAKQQAAGFTVTYTQGTVLFPLFMVPYPLSKLFKLALVDTGITYALEGYKKTDTHAISQWYYAFTTEATKEKER